MEFFSEKLTWLNILYNKMYCHKKNYFKLHKVKSEKSLLQKSYDWLFFWGYLTLGSKESTQLQVSEDMVLPFNIENHEKFHKPFT